MVERDGSRAHRAPSGRNGFLARQKRPFETAIPRSCQSGSLDYRILTTIVQKARTKCELMACEESKLKPWRYLHLSMKKIFFFNIPAASILTSYFPNLCLKIVAIQLHCSPNTIFCFTEHQPFAAPANLLFCSAVRDAVW